MIENKIKNIYDYMFSLCSKEQQNILKNFNSDIIDEECDLNSLIKKYSFVADNNKNTLLFEKKIENKNFTINFNLENISFITQSSFKENYTFTIETSCNFNFDYEDNITKIYKINFSINRNDIDDLDNNLDQLSITFLYENEKIIVDNEFCNIQKPINSLETSDTNSSYFELYIFKDEMFLFILENFIQLNNIYEVLELKYDYNFKSDEILSEILKHSIFLNSDSTLKNKNKLK